MCLRNRAHLGKPFGVRKLATELPSYAVMLELLSVDEETINLILE